MTHHRPHRRGLLSPLASRTRRSLRRSAASTFAVASLVLTACGSAEPEGGEPSGGTTRTVELEAVEFAFTADEAITIRAGDTIEFDVRNAGTLDHQLEVLSSESRSLGKTERIPPGGSRSVTVTFDEPGVFQVICDIDDHRSLGQTARFEVIG